MSNKTVAELKEMAKAASRTLDPTVRISMIMFLELMRERDKGRTDWFDLEVGARLNAERVLGYAYGCAILLGRTKDEPGDWDC